MSVLPDWMIERDVKIEPFAPQQKRPGKISFGVTSYGYDVRCGYRFQVFSPIHAREIDPKNFDQKMLVEVDLSEKHEWETYLKDGAVRWLCRKCGQPAKLAVDDPEPKPCPEVREKYALIPPHSFVLAESLETFRIPRDVLCVVVGKSTYARCGLVVNVTPGEPEWEGKWTIELSNTTPLPIRVYAGEGIMQCVFYRAEEACKVSYADKKGKYANQEGLTLPKVD